MVVVELNLQVSAVVVTVVTATTATTDSDPVDKVTQMSALNHAMCGVSHFPTPYLCRWLRWCGVFPLQYRASSGLLSLFDTLLTRR